MKELSYREYIAIKKLIEAIEAIDDLPEQYDEDYYIQDEEVENINPF